MEKNDIDPRETQEWLDALSSLVEGDSKGRAAFVLEQLQKKARGLGVGSSSDLTTAYVNSISPGEEPVYPGDLALEKKLEALIRWNAAITVAAANKTDGSLGGHIGTFASSCTLYQVGFNHFFKARGEQKSGDLVLIQGHASPGIYARAYLEGRLSETQMDHFRREVGGQGLSSYPHPWLMPDFWEFPTVSMGLGPLMAIYQARFMKYLNDRGIVKTAGQKVWAFCGDGEMDEPESLGGILCAGRKKLDNLIFVINCNLQRLDGLVHGNGKVVQELEGIFRGAGWCVLKVIWGSAWDALFEKDSEGVLQQALMDACDGDFQTYRVRGGAYMRQAFFGKDPRLLALVAHLSDDEIHHLLRGGHDPIKVYAAYKKAQEQVGQPTVILAKTVKGYGMGEAGDSRNVAHNQKKMKPEELLYFREFFSVPASDDALENYRRLPPDPKSPEIQYLHAKRKALGGYLPSRSVSPKTLEIPNYREFAKRLLLGTSAERQISSTTAFVQLLSELCKHPAIGQFVVPITPDESRTFGMEGLFRQLGIYDAQGQRYEPEDRQQVMWYKESKDGQILQDGINEAGAMCSWLSAASSYATHGQAMIPFYIFYSMFGMQRIGDLAWLAGDMRARGFLLGATSGRTTLNGEGLQHEDGHNLLMAGLIPTCRSYDPTYAYEVAVIIWHGMKLMLQEHQDIFFYITLMNENYSHPPMPEGVETGIIKGMYLLHPAKNKDAKRHVQLVGSGTILKEVEAAKELLASDFQVTANVWSMTSANELYRDAMEADRWNLLHPDQPSKTPYLTTCLAGHTGPVIVATDYVKLYAEQLRKFIPNRLEVLGTDGYGRSDSRPALRKHFEVDRYYIVLCALNALMKDDLVKKDLVLEAMRRYQIDPNKENPLRA